MPQNVTPTHSRLQASVSKFTDSPKAKLTIIFCDHRWWEDYYGCLRYREAVVPAPLTPIIGISNEDLKLIDPYNFVPFCD